MSNQWFRMYGDFINNPKVQILPEALRYRYVALLCIQCNGDYENRPDDEIALSLRVTVEEWVSTRNEFVRRGLLSPESFKISGWDKRQFLSDLKDPTAAERQKRYRNKIKSHRNATVTSRLPESDTDTETEKKVSKSRGSRFALVTLPPEWKSFCAQERPDLNPEETFRIFTDHWRSVPGQRGCKVDWEGTWRNWVRRENANAKRNADTSHGGKPQQPILGKPTWRSEGERLRAKYAAEAEREAQAAINGNPEPNLCIAEAVRQDTGGT